MGLLLVIEGSFAQKKPMGLLAGTIAADWALFAGIMALGQFSPGPDMILLTRVSLRNGKIAGWLVVAGIATGLCFHAALAIGGMSVLMAQGGFWEKGLSLLAAAYLGWLGWQMIRAFLASSKGENAEGTDGQPKGRVGWFVKGLLCNLLNPKVVVFFAGLTVVFLREERGAWWSVLLWATVVVEGLLLWGTWVVLLQNQKIRAVYQRGAKWFDLSFGIGLWILAGLLVWYLL